MAGIVSFVPRASPVHALHPATKATFFAAVAGCAVLFGTPAVLAGLLALCLAVLASARVLPEAWGMLRRGVLPIALMIGLLQGLFHPGARTALIALGPLSLKEEGLAFALVTVLRLLVFVCAFLPIVLATHPSALVAALEERGASPKVSYVVLATLQLIPLMQVRAGAIVDAQRSRALATTGSLLVRLHSLVALLSPLVIGALMDVEQRALALEARGMMLPTRKVRLRQVEDSPLDRRLRRRLALALGIAVALKVAVWISSSVA
jgi:energy-coupling factor transport system permease protein